MAVFLWLERIKQKQAFETLRNVFLTKSKKEGLKRQRVKTFIRHTTSMMYYFLTDPTVYFYQLSFILSSDNSN